LLPAREFLSPDPARCDRHSTTSRQQFPCRLSQHHSLPASPAPRSQYGGCQQ
jgi:hypothetical protein